MSLSHLNSRLVKEASQNPNVLHALIRKRSEIAGRIEHLQDELRKSVVDLDNIDASIHIFDPELELTNIRPKPVPPRHQAFKGEIARIVFTPLRNAKVKLRTQDVAARVLAEMRSRHHQFTIAEIDFWTGRQRYAPLGKERTVRRQNNWDC